MLDKAQRRDAGAKLIAPARAATQAVEALLADATAAVRRRVMVDDQVVDRLLDREQRATHGLAWLATYVESVRQLAAYAERMHAGGTLGELEELLVQLGIGEYLAQIQGGIPMSQGEIVRPADVGLAADLRIQPGDPAAPVEQGQGHARTSVLGPGSGGASRTSCRALGYVNP